MNTIRPLGFWGKLADIMMMPLMYLLSGCLERPQQTHFWNNQKLVRADAVTLNPLLAVRCIGDPNAANRTLLGIPIFHMPILGGWKKYTVLEPVSLKEPWHVGWIAGDVVGVSRIIIRGKVRMLIGPGEVEFFGITPIGEQLAICQCGEGYIGDNGPYSKVPLL